MINRSLRICVFAILFLTPLLSSAKPTNTQRLADSLKPFIESFAGKRESFSLKAKIEVPIGDKSQEIGFQLDQIDEVAFNLEVKHKDYWIKLQRRADLTTIILPLHEVAFVGHGEVAGTDTLKPRELTKNLVSQESMVGFYLPLVTKGDVSLLSLMLTSLLNPEYDEASNTWSHKGQYFWKFPNNETAIDFDCKYAKVRLELNDVTDQQRATPSFDGLKVTVIERAEVERQVARGARRAFEVLAPSPLLTAPKKAGRQASNGELRWVDSERVVLLEGTPEQIGAAHGKLLKAETQRCVDSVLYVFGTFQMIRSGHWFKHDLQAAYERLEPHIPEHHKQEVLALADSLEMDPELARIINVFPELFHCSGFALFGKATADGKLYHGRVLDYMTTIGLQDAATTFVIAPKGRIPFVTVGYAGFIGSVSGMNNLGISLGEMGGRGEGKWDGVPMATLMRRALEECESLDEVKELWESSPRTCEYYYVFADGKTNEALGVAATPEKIEFVEPGQSHPLLGEGIDDAVVLSSGQRLQTLRVRVKERYGQFDVENGKWLMSRPVSMKSNLHNVLFVPEDGVLYIAKADHKLPAAERPYTRLDLHKLLQSMNQPVTSE